MCSLEDIEVTEKNIQLVSYVDERGSGTHTKEIYHTEIDKGYYNCLVCLEYWHWTVVDRLEVWKRVKAHIN